MPHATRGKTDEHLDAVMQALTRYESEHPRADIVGYRQGAYSIRIRIIDPEFAGLGRAERHDAIWKVLEELPEETQSHLSTILLLTPAEIDKSFANLEFENPVGSRS
jgi:stress-induced morphogen